MSQVLSSRSQQTKIIQRIASLEEMLFEMRSNQVQKVTYGSGTNTIIIDGSGSTPVITLGSGITLTVDGSGNGKITVGNITISGDGAITVSDGTNTRVLLGFQSGGF